MSFFALNYDVKCLIFDHLDQDDLYTICLTTSQFYNIAQPVLYSAIRLGGHRRDQTHNYRVDFLLRTLLSKPELAAYIRKISFITPEPTEPWHDFTPLDTLDISEEDRNSICNFVQSTQVADTDSWVQGLRRGRVDAYLAVLLLNLPSVRFLGIAQEMIPSTEFLGQALRFLLGEDSPGNRLRIPHPGTLENLQHLICLQDIHEHRADMEPVPKYHTADLLPLFYLPEIKHLSIYMHIDPVPDFQWPAPTRPCPASLTSLEILKLHELHLVPILSATPSLRSLIWNRGYEIKVEESDSIVPTSGPWACVNLQLIRTALAHVKSTLNELKIREYNYSDSHRNHLARFQGPLSSLSLADFDKLTVLEIPITFVMGYPARKIQTNHFPPNLRELTVHTNFSEVGFVFLSWRGEPNHEVVYYNAMRRWLRNDAKRETPSLKKLTFVGTLAERELRPRCRAALRKLKDTIAPIGIEFCHDIYGYYFHEFGICTLPNI